MGYVLGLKWKRFVFVSIHILLTLSMILLISCNGGGDSEDEADTGDATGGTQDNTIQIYDPISTAFASLGDVENREAVVPPQCYTKTDGISNPCWTCHTSGNGLNSMDDVSLQAEYAFSDTALTNHWDNLFKDRTTEISAITDAEVLAYIRQDNYIDLQLAIETHAEQYNYSGWIPDLDFSQGFDAEGFANDGSWWRAFRYKPFLGTFWPTNGSTDDVIIRLPEIFYQDAEGNYSLEIYKINLAIVEAAMTISPLATDVMVRRTVEPISEVLAGVDLDRDGILEQSITTIISLPLHYVGAASNISVHRWLYPEGTEFLHTVRYVDPDSPTLLSARMKEVRYMEKIKFLEEDAVLLAYLAEEAEKDEGNLPVFSGNPINGLVNNFGWRVQGFIEDEQGRLRVQTEEEALFCMGCHSNLGVTVDQTFGFPRKVPGIEGWGHQYAAGIKDVPQAGRVDPEYFTYLQRVLGGDEFRYNDEMLAKFFPNGTLDEAAVLQASTQGNGDITNVIAPSKERAILLDKAYMVVVQEQSFIDGRDAVITPMLNVHQLIENGSTDLGESGQIYTDGWLFLDWE